jgi:hypothetical protein
MFSRDLEDWSYFDDELVRYISPSETIVIMVDSYETEDQGEMRWLWRVYDNGVPDLSGYDLFEDDTWDHEFTGFEDVSEAYNDILIKGMERNHY